ncbi:MAG: ring-hydroxylating oxygenase subunit alpha [Hyphomicrobiaceae bacterium]
MNVMDKGPARPAGRFRRDPERSYTLPASYYFDPDIYRREREAIFYRSWNYACHLSQVAQPGDFVTVPVADQGIVVIRGRDGVLRGFYNVCSHRAHELLKGCGNARLITCPYHAWTYQTDGRLRSAVGQKKVADFDAREFALREVRVETHAGFVFVNLDPQAPALAGLADGFEAEVRHHCPDIDKLVFSRRITYELKANWKNVVDNYLECYHCTVAHPAFVDLVDIKCYRTRTYGIYSTHISPPGRTQNTAYTLPSGEEGEFAGLYLWPNVAMNVFPGRANLGVLHIIPTGPETTLEHFDFFFLDRTPTAGEEEAIRYLDEVLQPEDIGLVESVQRGLHSRGYTQGRFIVDKDRTFISEHGLHHFHSLVLEALGELPTE